HVVPERPRTLGVVLDLPQRDANPLLRESARRQRQREQHRKDNRPPRPHRLLHHGDVLVRHGCYDLSLKPAGTAMSASATLGVTFTTSCVLVRTVARPGADAAASLFPPPPRIRRPRRPP